jgi:hypothetical protein
MRTTWKFLLARSSLPYSAATVAGINGTTDITPLTDLIVANVGPTREFRHAGLEVALVPFRKSRRCRLICRQEALRDENQTVFLIGDINIPVSCDHVVNHWVCIGQDIDQG